MRDYLLICISTLFFSSSTNRTNLSQTTSISNVVGEIFHDPRRDHHSFKICGKQDQIVQYYAFSEKPYKGERSALIEYFKKGYHKNKLEVRNESGLIRIRFIVNCKGNAGRFRILAMSSAYQPKEFSSPLTMELLNLTKEFNRWNLMSANGIYRDYYLYLIFKIKNGQLVDILP